MKRYLIYYVSKQSDPWFSDDFEKWKESADDCSVVIVDLQTCQRYWSGEWAKCDIC